MGAHLIAVGCRFSAEYEDPEGGDRSGPLGGIRVAEGMTGDIYHIGNCTTRTTTSYDSDAMHVRPELVIVPDNPAMLMLTNLRVLPVLP